MLYHLASTSKGKSVDKIEFLAERVKNESLKSVEQINAAIRYINDKGGEVINEKEFSESCGVGTFYF